MSDTNPELELVLPPPPLDPTSEDALRSAFHTLPIAKRMSYHEAMAVPVWSICIRNKACAIARRKQEPQ